MLFKKFNKSYYKLSVNIDKEVSKRLDEIAMFYFCSKSDIVNKSLIEYIKKFDKKMERLQKQKRD